MKGIVIKCLEMLATVVMGSVWLLLAAALVIQAGFWIDMISAIAEAIS